MELIVRDVLVFGVAALSLFQLRAHWNGGWKVSIDMITVISQLYLVIQYGGAQTNLVYRLGVLITACNALLWGAFLCIWFSRGLHRREFITNLEDGLKAFLFRRDVTLTLWLSAGFPVYCCIVVVLGVLPV